jgi:hypothetical protein
MAHFIQRVAGNVLWAIGIEVRQGELIGVRRFVRIHLNRWIVADTARFGILRPQVGLDQLRRQELEDCNIAGREPL